MHTTARLAALSSTVFLAAALTAQTSTLSGRVIDPSGVGVANVQVKNDAGAPTTYTDALGNFLLTGLSNRTYTIDIIPPLGTFVPQQTSIRVNIATTLPTVTVQPGALASGIMLLPTGAPVTNGNVNAYDAAGNKLYTPGDATSLTGAFAVTVPLGTIRFRTVTPSALNLVPQDHTYAVAGPVSLGTISLQQGYRVSGTFTDVVSGVPVGNVRVTTFNGITGEEILQLNPLASSLGAFSLLLPVGSFDLQCDPPTTNAHLPKIKHGVIVVGTTALGFVTMDRAVFLSGTLNGPTGPVNNADIDVYTADGEKLYTTNDYTTATGTFRVPVPVGPSRLTFQPPVASGLSGLSTAVASYAVDTALGILTTTTGHQVDLTVLGPNGPELDANIDLFDPVTGAPVVLSGDHSSASGAISTIVPAGTWNLTMLTRQGSATAPLSIPLVPVYAPFAQTIALPAKTLRLDLQGLGVQTTNQGGYLPASLTVENLTPNLLPITLEVVVRYPGGAESTVFPPLPVDVFPLLNLTLSNLFLPTVPVPANEMNRMLRLLVRARDAATATVLDSAYINFVVQ